MEALATPQTPQTTDTGRRGTAPRTFWIALVAAGAVVIGSLGTWATALGGIVTVNGTSGDGVITVILALVALAGLWAYRNKPRRWAAVGVLLLGILAFAVGIHALVGIENTVPPNDSLFAGEDVVDAGWGLYLVVVGSGILGLASFGLARRPAPASA
jgi:hypothetical protein